MLPLTAVKYDILLLGGIFDLLNIYAPLVVFHKYQYVLGTFFMKMHSTCELLICMRYVIENNLIKGYKTVSQLYL